MLRQGHRCRANRPAVLPDEGLTMHSPPSPDDRVKEAIEDGITEAGLGGGSQGRPHLPQDLGLTEDHGIQAGGHAVKVANRFRVRMEVHLLIRA